MSNSNRTPRPQESIARRNFMATSTVASLAIASGISASSNVFAEDVSSPAANAASDLIVPPAGKRILLSCKLTIDCERTRGQEIIDSGTIAARRQSGIRWCGFRRSRSILAWKKLEMQYAKRAFIAHNAINHDHWKSRLTLADESIRAKGVANIEHCIRVSHAIGGSAVLIVIGRGEDGTPAEVDDRARTEIKKLIPLAASLGQSILIENVWNKIHYDHDAPAEQTADKFVAFVDSFNSPWVGMYYDIGNHWKYGQPRQWLNAFGRRAVKLDIKGF